MRCRHVSILLLALLTACTSAPRRMDPLGVVPDDFSVDLTILSRPEGDRADRRTSRLMLEPDGTLRYAAGRGMGPNTVPPMVRRLDREQMARVWDLAARLGLTDPSRADTPGDVRRVKPPTARGCIWLLGMTGDHDHWSFMRRADGDSQPDAAIVSFGRELGSLAWAPDRGQLVASSEPIRWNFGSDPYAAYRGEASTPLLVASAKPAPEPVKPPPPVPEPAPEPVKPPPPAPVPAPEPVKPPPPSPEPAPEPVKPPPPAPEPAPEPVKPPPPAPEPAPEPVKPPPPAPEPVKPPPPAPAAEPVPQPSAPTAPPPAAKPSTWAPTWPLDIRRIHVVWGRVHIDLPSLSSCERTKLSLRRVGNTLSPILDNKVGSLTIDDINAKGGGSIDREALARIEDAVINCTEAGGLLAARVSSWLEPPSRPKGAADLWLLVEVPLPDAVSAAGLPKDLQQVPAEERSQ